MYVSKRAQRSLLGMAVFSVGAASGIALSVLLLS